MDEHQSDQESDEEDTLAEENAPPDYVEAEDHDSADDPDDGRNDCDANAPEDASDYDGACRNDEAYAHADHRH